MRADDHASITTRDKKDRALTPERLRDRWQDEADCGRAAAWHGRGRSGARPPAGTSDSVGRTANCSPRWSIPRPGCARRSPGSAKPTSSNASPPCRPVAGRWRRSSRRSRRFLSAELVVRLAPGADRRRPSQWSTVEHRNLEDRLLAQLHRPSSPPTTGAASIRTSSRPRSPPNGRRWATDQAEAVRVLCGVGAAIRALVTPAELGQTTILHAAVSAGCGAVRSVILLAPTHKAIAELRGRRPLRPAPSPVAHPARRRPTPVGDSRHRRDLAGRHPPRSGGHRRRRRTPGSAAVVCR